MRIVVLYFFATIAVALGVKWNDFRGGDGVKIPMTEKQAKAANWMLSERDDTHEVNWYSLGDDWRFAVGFEQATGDCNGVRIKVLQNEVDSSFNDIYKDLNGMFQLTEHGGEKAYKSLVYLNPKGYITEKGQQVKAADEVAYFAFLRVNGEDKMIYRDICSQYVKRNYEQICKPGYGLVMSTFNEKTDCDKLEPFYAIYDPKGKSDLIGFGWISFFKDTPPANSFLKELSNDEVEAMFPNRPSCLTSSKVAVTEVWLSYTDSRTTTCSKKSWIEAHCSQVTQEVEEPHGYYALAWEHMKNKLTG